MSQVQQLESLMIADCGSTITKVVLLDTVEGQYRFVAYAESPSTVDAPWEDVSVGVVRAIYQLEEMTGRTFLGPDEHLVTPERGDGSGVDRFLAVSSAAHPLRIVLAGLSRDVSLASARRAALATYTKIEGVVSPDAGSSQRMTDDEQINLIWEKAPDAICIVGGTDGGGSGPVLEMVRDVVRVALYLMGEDAPPVIYAGNSRLRQTIAELLGADARLHIVDNVRPLSDAENIGPAHEELELLFCEEKLQRLPGIEMLRAWSPSAILPTARAADYAIRYCEQAWRSSPAALGVDIGSSHVTINYCRAGQPKSTIRGDLGVGYSLPDLLSAVETSDIARWLPFEIDEHEVRNRLLNKALYPNSIPQMREDLLLEQAAAREALRVALADALPGWTEQVGNRLASGTLPYCDPIVGSGSVLTHAPYHGHAALMMLDALQPVGITTMYLDEYNLIPALGMAATVEPLALVQVLRAGGLTFLGTVVSPVGEARPGDRVLTVKPVDRKPSIRSDVKYGSLEAIPFQFFEPGTQLELVPARGIDVGSGPGKSVRIVYRGGTVGLIIDARGRPLVFEDDAAAQRQRMDHWLWEMMSA